MQLPLRQLRGLVESGHFGCCGVLQEQSDGRADEESGSVCRFYQSLHRQQRHAEGTPEAGGGPPPHIRAHQGKRHGVICILNFVFVLCLFILNYLVLGSCNARNVFIILYEYSVFVFQSLIIIFLILVFRIFRCYIIHETETFSFQIRRVSTAFVIVLNNAYVWCLFGLVRLPSHK